MGTVLRMIVKSLHSRQSRGLFERIRGSRQRFEPSTNRTERLFDSTTMRVLMLTPLPCLPLHRMAPINRLPIFSFFRHRRLLSPWRLAPPQVQLPPSVVFGQEGRGQGSAKASAALRTTVRKEREVATSAVFAVSSRQIMSVRLLITEPMLRRGRRLALKRWILGAAVARLAFIAVLKCSPYDGERLTIIVMTTLTQPLMFTKVLAWTTTSR
mmetsp:Transcript_28765/g.63327  ORF Transcript_28765/g.63327 Transcript_28765/m.63327 type:complete len:212 (+) Transcript_28765:1743-2378(+)